MRTRSVRWATLATPLALAPFLFLACVDDAPKGPGAATQPPACSAEEGEICSHLEATGGTTIPIRGYNTTVDLGVRWTNRVGDAIPNGEVSWKIPLGGDPKGSVLQASSSRTNGDGVATVTLRSGGDDANFSVEATAPTAPKVTFTVQVFSKDAGEVKVNVHYDGGIYGPQARAFDDIQVLVFMHGATGPGKMSACDQAGFDPYDDATLPYPARETEVLNTLPKSHSFVGFERDDRVTVLAFGRKIYPEKTIGVAWGCWSADANSDADAVKPGATLNVDLALKDLTPRYKGTYEVTSNFDFLAMVPDNIETWIRAFGNLFENPGIQLLEWLRNVNEVDQFFNQLPGNFDQAISEMLNGLLNDLLERAPESIKNIRTGTVDVFNILTELQIRSELRFDQEPAAPAGGSQPGRLDFPNCDALAEGDCPQVETWVALGFDWGNSAVCEGSADERCNGFREYGLEAYGLNIVNGEFNAHTTGLWELTIDQHSLSLDWGELILFAVEQMILPMIFDSDVDGLDDLLFILIGGRDCIAGGDPAENCCTNFARSMDSFPEAIVKSLCKTGVPLLVTQLRSQLTGQDVDTGEGFVIGTSDAFDTIPEADRKSCTLYDEAPADMTVDHLGKEAGPRCSWRGFLKIGDTTPDPIEAEFHGVRKQ